MNVRCSLVLLFFASVVVVPAAQDVSPALLTAADQQSLVFKIAALVKDEYMFTDVADRTAAALTERARANAYDVPRPPADFAAALTKELLDLTHDKHVRVRFAPAATGTRMPQEIDPAIDNFGVHRVEWLRNRIGYLKIDRFYEAEASRKAFDAALALLAPASAIVIDLRENGGGSDANNLLASYFFAERTLFNELRWRKEETEQMFTDPSVRPQLTAPLYILTSARTFSAAEAFAYSLQQRKRATIVGERTGGGANPNRYFPLAPGLAVSIAIGTTVNPVSGSNWEGTGVVPDVEVPAAEALDTALERATAK